MLFLFATLLPSMDPDIFQLEQWYQLLTLSAVSPPQRLGLGESNRVQQVQHQSAARSSAHIYVGTFFIHCYDF